MLLAGIWVDASHSVLNAFALPTIQELIFLYETGMTWKHDGVNVVTSKFITLICTVDSIARPALLNMTQFNGKYECTFCYAEKKRIKQLGRVYPVTDSHSRVDSEVRAHMNQAYELKNKIFGIRVRSTLGLLRGFNLARGVVVESMHNLYLGVAKQHTMLLLDGKSSDSWYRGNPKRLRP